MMAVDRFYQNPILGVIIAGVITPCCQMRKYIIDIVKGREG